MPQPTTATSTLSQKAIRGIGWSTASKFFRQFVQLFFQLLLARWLSPADFGLIGMIMVFTTLAEILRNLGLGPALIQRNSSQAIHYHSAFWATFTAGLLLNLSFQVLAPVIAQLYGIAELENMVRVFSLIFLIGSLNVVQESILQKNMEFKRLFLMDATAVFISGLAAVWMAFHGFGAWTLIYQYLLLTIISTLILWISSSWKPRWRFSWAALRDLQQFGNHYTGHELLNFVSRNADNLLIGKYIGAAALGFYSRAYFLMLQPINITNQVLARVMFPLLSKYQHDREQIKRIYLKSTGMIGYLLFPVIVYVWVMAEPLVYLLLGPQWTAVAAILRVFCLYCLVDSVGITTTWIYKSLGRTRQLFYWSIYSTLILLIAMGIGLQWGVLGVAWSYTLAFLVLLWLPGWWLAFRIIQLRIGDMLLNLIRPFVASLLSGGITLLALQFTAAKWHPLLHVTAGFLLMLLLYCFFSKRINSKQTALVWQLMQPYLRKKIRFERKRA